MKDYETAAARIAVWQFHDGWKVDSDTQVDESVMVYRQDCSAILWMKVADLAPILFPEGK